MVGGVVSPVHQAYGKGGLAPARDRVAMCRLATARSSWIETSAWETVCDGWTRTADVLEAYERTLNGGALDGCARPGERVRVLLLCGSDLLRSALDPKVWDPVLARRIFGGFGVACLQRVGTDAAALVRESALLSEFSHNIHVVPQPVQNNISSTSVRQLLSQGLSVRYLVPDDVADYLESAGGASLFAAGQ